MEQQWAAKADGQTDAAATTKQVVEKQASGANIGGGLAANSNVHLGSGLVAGTLNSIDEDGNFSPERFAAGFLTGLVGGKAVATGLRKMTPKLYNKILGAAEKMPQMANGNPRLLGKLYSNGKDVSLNSFAGEKAITANVGKLDQAKAMLEKGADEVEIWQKTGWFKDKDGAWKFEIGDGNAKLNPGFQSGGRLGELLDHEELFKAYPELKDVRVVKIGDETPDGAALSVKDAAQKEKRGIYNVTYNDKTATLVRQDLDDINSALLYERGDKEVGAKHTRIRHLRDENKVGYVKDTELLNLGENIRAFIKKYEEPFIDKRGARIYEWQDENGVRFRVVVDNRRGNGQTPPPASESIITFYSDRNLKDRMDFKNPKVKYDVNLKEWHKDNAQIKHVENNGNFSDSPNIYKTGKEGYYSPAKNEIGLRDIGDKSTLIHEVQHAIQEIEDFARGSGAKDESYRLSHGEAEARNVQNRLNLDGKAHPHETFDVNPNETIVSKDGEVSYSRKIEEIKREHPNVEKELDESIAAMRKDSFNDSNFKNSLLKTIDDFIAETKGHPASGNLARPRSLATQQLGKSVNLSDKQLAVLKNDIKNADFKVISDSKIYFDKIGKDGDKKRFFVDIAQDGSLRVDAYAKSQIDNIPVKQSALEELAGTGDAARLKNMSFEVKAAYRNELDPIKKEAILKTAEYNALKKEMRGIYNVINNNKESTNVYKDLQKIDDAIKLEQGSKKKGGAVHIQKHLDPSAKGAVTQQEVMGIGKSVREYIKKYKEPFVDKDGGKIYEWQDKDGVRFRVAVYDKIKKSAGAGSTTRITTTDAYESIITFYSDRNLNGRMDFLDPRLRAETKFEEFKAKNLDENGNIKDGLSLC